MSEISFSLNLPVDANKLFQIATDVKKMPQFFLHLKSLRVIKENNNEFITEEVYSILKHNIHQKSKTKISPLKLEIQVIDGPLKNTVVHIVYEKNNEGTKVSINANLKVSKKYIFLKPLIKKRYKITLIAILYKMNTLAMNEAEIKQEKI